MIPEPLHPHEARYDTEGNIVIPNSGRASRHRTHAEETVSDLRSDSVIATLHKQISRATAAIMQEGLEQYHWSYHSLAEQCKGALTALWTFLAQPVWVIGRRKKVRQYSRGTLFALDTLRFGSTFAFIFLALFVALNYQSFSEMASAYLAPIQQAQSALASRLGTTDQSQHEGGIARSSDAQALQGDLLSYLPPVGPSQNILIIPRLGMNVPVITPPFEALMKENWEQLETDIQNGLEDGVVHYPGTARPGQAGNFFVTGHSSYYPWAPGEYKTVFSRLHQLEVGDEYFVYFNGEKYRYIVRAKNEVKPSNVHVLDQPLDRRVATLMTCTPVGTTLRRLIVSAEEVDPITGASMVVGEQHTRELPKIQTQMLPI